MNIPDYSSYSAITSSTDNTSTIINTKNDTNNKYKLNNRFNFDSESEISQSNIMRRTKASKKPTIQYYTINDNTDSNSITSTSENTKIPKTQKTAICLITLVPTTILHHII